MIRPFCDLRPENQRRYGPETFDLRTAVVTADAPVAEVLAIVAQQVEVLLTESRAGALHNLLRRIPRVRVIDDV